MMIKANSEQRTENSQRRGLAAARGSALWLFSVRCSLFAVSC